MVEKARPLSPGLRVRRRWGSRRIPPQPVDRHPAVCPLSGSRVGVSGRRRGPRSRVALACACADQVAPSPPPLYRTGRSSTHVGGSCLEATCPTCRKTVGGDALTAYATSALWRLSIGTLGEVNRRGAARSPRSTFLASAAPIGSDRFAHRIGSRHRPAAALGDDRHRGRADRRVSL